MRLRTSAESLASSGRLAPRALETRVLAADAMPLPSMKIQACVLKAMPMAPRLTSGFGSKPAHHITVMPGLEPARVQTIFAGDSVASYRPHVDELNNFVV